MTSARPGYIHSNEKGDRRYVHPTEDQVLVRARLHRSPGPGGARRQQGGAGQLGDHVEESDFEDADLEITLEIEVGEDGKLTGSWSTPRGDDDIEDVKWDGKTLSFVRIVEVLGREVDVEHTAKVTGDSLEGEIEYPRREVAFSGKRER